MKNSIPLTPQEILRDRQIDNRIIEAVNQILKDKFIGNSVDIKLKTIKEKMTEMFGEEIDFQDLFDRKQFDFEDYFAKYNWKVVYDKPGYNETYDGYYIFKPLKN